MVMKLTYQPEAELNTVAAGEFKAKCLRLMDQAVVEQRAITEPKRGQVVGQFVPVPRGPKNTPTSVGLFSEMKILGDIVSPLPQEWTLPEWAWDSTGEIKKSHKKAKKK